MVPSISNQNKWTNKATKEAMYVVERTCLLKKGVGMFDLPFKPSK